MDRGNHSTQYLSRKTSTEFWQSSIGAGLMLGFYNQQHLDALDENATLIEEIQKTKGTFYYNAIGYLKKFKFEENQIKSPVRIFEWGSEIQTSVGKVLFSKS